MFGTEPPQRSNSRWRQWGRLSAGPSDAERLLMKLACNKNRGASLTTKLTEFGESCVTGVVLRRQRSGEL